MTHFVTMAKPVGSYCNMRSSYCYYLKADNGQAFSSLRMNDEVLEEYITRVDQELGKSIKKVGLVKYDAFNNTKNKLSFALALLDRNNNGIVINNIYGIEDSNAYAKPIEKGKSKYNLSAEEEDAIKKAMQK